MSEMSKEDGCGQMHLFLLKSGGLLSFDGRNLRYPLTVLLSLYVHFCHILITSMYVCNIVMTALNDNQCSVESIAEAVGICGVHIRFLIMFFNRDKIAMIVNESNKLWVKVDEREADIIRSFVEKSLRLAHFYLIACGFMCLFYLIVSQLTASSSYLNSTFTRALPYPFYADVQQTPWYELSIAIQMVGMISISVSSSGVDTAAPYFIMIACGHLNLLCSRLQNLITLVDYDDDDNARNQVDKIDAQNKMTDCIIYHQEIIKYGFCMHSFCKKVEKLTNSLFMVQLISTTYNMSLIGLKLVGDDQDKFKYSSVLSLLMCQLFICQWAPDLLVSQSESLARSAYFIPSAGDVKKKLAKLFHILTLRSQQPIQLTAGGWVNLSMECFGSMITSAMSFFTVLRSLN